MKQKLRSWLGTDKELLTRITLLEKKLGLKYCNGKKKNRAHYKQMKV